MSFRDILIRWVDDSQILFFAMASIERHSMLPIWMKCFAPLDSGMSKSPGRGRAESTGNEFLRMIRTIRVNCRILCIWKRSRSSGQPTSPQCKLVRSLACAS